MTVTAATTEFRYLILDEDGLPLRKFYWKDEAERHLFAGMTLVRLPKTVRKPPVDWNNFEPALF